MRIVFANPIGGLGGAELFLLEMLQQVRQELPDAELHLVVGAEGPLVPRAEALGVHVTRLPWSSRLASLGDSSAHRMGGSRIGRWWRLGWQLAGCGTEAVVYARRFRQLMRRLQPDVIHSNGMKFHVIAGLSRVRVPTVWFLHDYLQSRGLMRRVLPRLSGRVTQLIANSKSVAADTAPLIPRPRMDVVYCGVDESRFFPGPGDPARLDYLAGLPPAGEGTVRVGLVATYARWKGQDVLLQAAAQLSEAAQPLRFYIVGGPIYASAASQFTREELQQQARDLGIADRVGFVPFQEDPAWIYRTLDIVVHASRQPEPFGRTILEALACGRCVIATQAGGAAEIFEPDVSAIGVTPGSVTELAAALQRLTGDAALRATLGQAAIQRAAEFSQVRMGRELVRIYQRVAGS